MDQRRFGFGYVHYFMRKHVTWCVKTWAIDRLVYSTTNHTVLKREREESPEMTRKQFKTPSLRAYPRDNCRSKSRTVKRLSVFYILSCFAFIGSEIMTYSSNWCTKAAQFILKAGYNFNYLLSGGPS